MTVARLRIIANFQVCRMLPVSMQIVKALDMAINQVYILCPCRYYDENHFEQICVTSIKISSNETEDGKIG